MSVLIIIFFLGKGCDSPNKPINPKIEVGGYLFAHMMKDDYGSLYYSISRDGLNWSLLNQGRRINNHYRGHPDICRGRNGEYYMIGVDGLGWESVLWRSDDLITWKIQKRIPQHVFFDNPGFAADSLWYGAPKMFFDEDSDQYFISWHVPKEDMVNGQKLWESMRTFYILSTDLENFTEPARLFNFDAEDDLEMATIDVIIRKDNDAYFALIKDERWPENSQTGKTIRVSFSNQLTGPYSNPSPPITPTWYEAPSIVPGKDNKEWLMYAENYPHKYTLFSSKSLNGPWTVSDIHMENIRHGCVIQISAEQYNDIILIY